MRYELTDHERTAIKPMLRRLRWFRRQHGGHQFPSYRRPGGGARTALLKQLRRVGRPPADASWPALSCRLRLCSDARLHADEARRYVGGAGLGRATASAAE